MSLQITKKDKTQEALLALPTAEPASPVEVAPPLSRTKRRAVLKWKMKAPDESA